MHARANRSNDERLGESADQPIEPQFAIVHEGSQPKVARASMPRTTSDAATMAIDRIETRLSTRWPPQRRRRVKTTPIAVPRPRSRCAVDARYGG
jgi:hypothetical protein